MHVTRFACLGAARAGAPPIDAVFFITMLREPSQRLFSEFRHLNGRVSCGRNHHLPPSLQHVELPYWQQYQPVLCRDASKPGHALLSGHRSAAEPPSSAFVDYTARLQRDLRSGGPASLGSMDLFERWLNISDNCAHDRMSRQLAPMGCVDAYEQSPAFPSEAQQRRMRELAFDNLRERTLFGLTEHYDASVRLLNARLAAEFRGHPLGRMRLPLPTAAETPKSRGAYSLSVHARQLVHERSAQDVALYAEATREFEAQLSRFGVV